MKKLMAIGLIFLSITASGCAGLIIKSPERIYQQADYTVLIAGYDDSSTYFLGSGVVLNLPDHGLCVLTAGHVVESALDMTPFVTFLANFKTGDSPQELELIGYAKNYDAALLKFSDPKFQPPQLAVIGRAYDLRPGSKIVAIGSCKYGNFWFSANGYLITNPGLPSPGLSATWKAQGLKWPTALTMCINIFRGFSGGPVLNERGELVGIVVGFNRDEAAVIQIALPIDDVLKDTFEKP